MSLENENQHKHSIFSTQRNMHLVISIIITLLGVLFVQAAPVKIAPVEPSWARPEDLVAFWPLSNFYKLRDVSGNGHDAQGFSGSEPSNRPGPFGDPMTCYQSYANQKDAGVFQVKDAAFSLKRSKSFTMSFFLKDINKVGGGFIQFLDESGQTNNNPLRFVFDRLYKFGFYGGGSTAAAALEDVYSDKIWNYLAITINADVENNDCSMQLFSRFGPRSEPVTSDFLCRAIENSVGGLRLGSTFGFLNDWRIDTLVSCFMFYKTALTADEIYKNYDSCRAVLMGPPCGAPRLSLPLLPKVPAVTPKPGQFPWLASVHWHTELWEVTCSATIISPYHLLTAGSCFDRHVRHPENYFAWVGNYDHMSMDSYTIKHKIRTVSFYNLARDKFHAISLVELEDPIDFSSPYVSETCLPTEDMSPLFSNDSFVIGWGDNGRPITETRNKLRYSSLTVVDDNQCANSWALKPFTSKSPLKCFLGKPDVKVPCKRDLGSPLVVPVGDRLVQVGFYNDRDEDCSVTSTKMPIFTRIDTVFKSVIREAMASFQPRHVQ